METPAVQHINLVEVVRSRLWRHTPRWLVWPLERLIRQKEMNAMLDALQGLEGPEFCRGVLRELDFGYSVDQSTASLPEPGDKRVVYCCNHPLGGLDGMALIDLIDRHHGGAPVHFVVNDLLSAVAPLRKVFIPINKHGAQSRDDAQRLDEAFAGPDPVIVFPAGLVSRKGPGGRIADLEWHKMFVAKAVASGRDIVPLFFEARNTNLFYNFAKLRAKLGLKFNLEMALLPSEVFKSRGKRATVRVGQRIPHGCLRGGRHSLAEAAEIRRATLALNRS